VKREDFLSNVRDYIELQSVAGISALEWMIRFIFAANSRADVIYSVNQMLIGGTDTDVEAALDSQLPKAVAIALGYSD
jgi:hypothetical protein